MVPIGKFPLHPIDGTEVSDEYGNRWRYSTKADAWISKGVIRGHSLVTENNNGLIDPDIFNRLLKLDEYLKTQVDLRPLKLYPGYDAYWYYFRSSDKLFRFKPEGPSELRIEIDKGRLFQILLKQMCPGGRGPNGPKGDKGRDGRPGFPEICYFPSATLNSRLDFAIYTPTPLLPGGVIELPNNHVPEVSVRLFKISEKTVTASVDQMQHMAILLHAEKSEFLPSFQRTRDLLLKRAMGEKYAANLCDLPMSQVAIITDGSVVDTVPSVTVEISPIAPYKVTVSSTLPIDVARTTSGVKFDPVTNIVCGSIYLQAGYKWDDISKEWCVKSRQKGPDGLQGEPGGQYMKIVQCTMDDTNVTAVCPIINLRLDCDLDIIYSLCADLLDEVCVGNIRLLANSNTLTDSSVLKSVYAAVQMTLEECKFLNKYEIVLVPDELPELELVHWDPQPGCNTKRDYNRHEFNWIPITDVPACDPGATWYGPSTVRPGKYPWQIVRAPEPSSDPCCVAQGTLIHTASGLWKIEDLKVGDKVWTPVGYQPLTKVFDNGEKECLQVAFADGTQLITTLDHRFLVGGILVEAKDLQSGDQVPVVSGSLEYLCANNYGLQEDFELGYILGYILGDGWISDNSVGIVTFYRDVVAFTRCYEYLAKRFGYHKISEPSKTGVLNVKWTDQTTKTFFQQLGYYKNLKQLRVEVPDSIYQQSFLFYQGFFSALLSTDGCITKWGDINIVHSVLDVVPKVCKRLLDYFGISSCLKTHRQSPNQFITELKDCYRVDLHHDASRSVACHRLLEKSSKAHLLPRIHINRNQIADQELLQLNSVEFESGLIAGAFMFYGCYNNATERAAVQKKMPISLRLRLPSNLSIPNSGRKFYKRAANLIGRHLDAGHTPSWCAGFLAARLHGQTNIKRNKFYISRNNKIEAELVFSSLIKLGCTANIVEYATPFTKTQYRICVCGSSSIYRLFCITGHRQSVVERLQPPQAGKGVVAVKAITPVGVHRVYDYCVPPSYLMAAEGKIVYDCQDDFFWCPNVQDAPVTDPC